MIPIFRARKIDSDEYAIGYLMSVVEYENLCCLRETEANYVGGDICDLLTLSIHFPDMLDNQGNKIFASLQKDGKGGDICYVEDVSYGKLEGVAKYQNHSFRIDRKGKSMGVSLQCSDLKVIGIQG